LTEMDVRLCVAARCGWLGAPTAGLASGASVNTSCCRASPRWTWWSRARDCWPRQTGTSDQNTVKELIKSASGCKILPLCITLTTLSVLRGPAGKQCRALQDLHGAAAGARRTHRHRGQTSDRLPRRAHACVHAGYG
jgi:hypothetical protein